MKAQFSEAIKYKDGVLYNLTYHQARVSKTLAEFGGKEISLARVLSEISAPAQKGVFKCRMVYGRDVESVEFTPYSFRQISTVGIIEGNSVEYAYKYTDRNLLSELLRQAGCDDIIIIKQGFVTDAFAANLVFESRDGLFTPTTHLLPGTKRQLLLDTGRIKEAQVAVGDIQKYERVRFINAMIDLEDNICIETRKIKVL